MIPEVIDTKNYVASKVQLSIVNEEILIRNVKMISSNFENVTGTCDNNMLISGMQQNHISKTKPIKCTILCTLSIMLKVKCG